MKTAIAAASFALIAALSGLSTAHAASFNDRRAIPDAAVSVSTGRQDPSQVPVIHGFNQRSHHADAARDTGAARAPVVAGVHCDLPPRLGFNESSSFASC
ncbi:MAG: hypothetical protein MUC53_03480 [Candidatus Contendobacter sp.]|jgi:hypothetical protein|nr:hypothetical protein [Candidatus Contendobacter sp.]